MASSKLVAVLVLIFIVGVSVTISGSETSWLKEIKDDSLRELMEEKVKEIVGLNTTNESWEDWITDKIKEKLKGLKDLVEEKFHGKNLTAHCKAMKNSGKVPSSLDEMLKGRVFGFPYFNEKTKTITVKPGVTLSYLFGFKQPIKIGSRDYVIAGYAGELLAMLECFSDYKVIGSSLHPDGHWYNNTGTIKLQLSNLRESKMRLIPGGTVLGIKVTNGAGLQRNDNVWEMMFKISVRRLIKFINPAKIVKELNVKLTPEDAAIEVSGYKLALQKIKEWLPGNEKLINKLTELYANESLTLKDKISNLLTFLKEEDNHNNKIREQWVGWDNVSKNRKLLLTITMYSKPENSVRSTYDTGRATLFVKDIKTAIEIFLDKKNKSGI